MASLAERLTACWERFRSCFRTRTRDPSPYAYHYLAGQLRLPTGRHFTGLAHCAGVAMQNLQHFMSYSPWSAQAVVAQVQAELAALPGLGEDGCLVLDESAEEKAGPFSVGAADQFNGRLEQVAMSQVGVFLAYTQGPLWTWVDGELYLPAHWFGEAWKALRKKTRLPPARTFETKYQLAWRLLQRAQAGPLRFRAVCCDAFYGKCGWLRAQMDTAGLCYMADVACNTGVYLEPPVLPPAGRRGPPRKNPTSRHAWQGQRLRVDQVSQAVALAWQRVRVRPTERGWLADRFAALRVWTVREGVAAEEWLVLRREADGNLSYALSNVAADTPLAELARLKCARYFVERAHQEAKSDLGWDEHEARLYPAWEHHLALTILASWFIAQTKWDWGRQYARDPRLLAQWEMDVLPALSINNVRTLLRATLPLPQLTAADAAALVVHHLEDRTRARRTRLRKQQHCLSP